MKIMLGLALTSAMTLFAAQSSAQNLVLNSDFEAPNAVTISCYQNATAGSWTSFGPVGNRGSCLVESLYSGAGLTWPTARTSTQMMYVNYLGDSGTGVRQNVPLVANTNYRLSFSMAGINGDAGAPNVDVTLSNGIGTQHFSRAAGASWSDFVWDFVAPVSGSTTLTFTATSGPVNIDAISLSAQAVPEPGGAVMMLAGLAVLIGVVRRRRWAHTE